MDFKNAPSGRISEIFNIPDSINVLLGRNYEVKSFKERRFFEDIWNTSGRIQLNNMSDWVSVEVSSDFDGG